MNRFILFTFFALFTLACQDKTETTNVTPINEETLSEVTIHIEGMMCNKACGPKIQKELYELDCVEKVNINFIGMDEDNSATVSYHPATCDLDILTEKIEHIGGGLYSVTKIQ